MAADITAAGRERVDPRELSLEPAYSPFGLSFTHHFCEAAQTWAAADQLWLAKVLMPEELVPRLSHYHDRPKTKGLSFPRDFECHRSSNRTRYSVEFIRPHNSQRLSHFLDASLYTQQPPLEASRRR
jgi:hypothetical protein